MAAPEESWALPRNPGDPGQKSNDDCDLMHRVVAQTVRGEFWGLRG